MALPQLQAGIQDFPILIKNGYTYVDKTRFLYALINKERPGCFLARPRRFGKSLLVSTLACLFKGERELFKGLWIDSSDYNWQPHPVIRLDFTSITSDTSEALTKSLKEAIASIATKYGIKGIKTDFVKSTFNNLLEELYNRFGPVVILVDEYDQPISRYIDDPDKAEKNRDVLNEFYSNIKSQESYLRFIFVTGVSQFTKISLFSTLNNLNSLSFREDCADLLGLTENEIKTYFMPTIEHWAKKRNEAPEDTLALLKTWYNGYSFTESNSSPKVYNPISVLNFLKSGTLKDYWFETGTPTMAIKLAQKRKFPLLSLENDVPAGHELEQSYDVTSIDIHTLLYQTGYLTIRKFDEASQTFFLNFPNEEVRRSFANHLLPLFSTKNASDIQGIYYQLTKHLQQHNFQQFFDVFNIFLDSIPHNIHKDIEAYYHSLLYLFLKTLGFKVGAEVPTSHGRMDLLLKTDTDIFVFEFKIDKTAQEALNQILAREYHTQFKLDKRPITLIGANFNSKSRKLDAWVSQKG
ncbi:MAG TPA: AAA family ATPase [Chlamydiales bacterium]|nr:AAA family ATPase [Chlamydiales bacterium]